MMGKRLSLNKGTTSNIPRYQQRVESRYEIYFAPRSMICDVLKISRFVLAAIDANDLLLHPCTQRKI